MKKQTWWIVCVKREGIEAPVLHTHITGVGTGDRADWADMRWELGQVLEAIAEGDTFVIVQNGGSGVTAVKAGPCPFCGQIVIGLGDEAVLENLPTCRFDRPESDFVYGGSLFS
jgi:hypothetical protein